LQKRRELLATGVNLVEVDLLRWGHRVIATLPEQPYHILISRADEQPQSRVWSFGLSNPIPPVPLPLLAADEHVPLPLQEAYQVVYQARGFRIRLDYQEPPTGRLSKAQHQYFHSRLVREGLLPD
jgi:hypothetical protein